MVDRPQGLEGGSLAARRVVSSVSQLKNQRHLLESSKSDTSTSNSKAVDVKPYNEPWLDEDTHAATQKFVEDVEAAVIEYLVT